MSDNNSENKEKNQADRKNLEKLLGIELSQEEEVSPETLQELSNNKGDDNE